MSESSPVAGAQPMVAPDSAGRLRQRPFWLAIAACVQFVVLTAVAMLVYPGGTVTDPEAQGYRFFQNFFSDLGRTQTPLGAPNTAAAILFFVALTLAGLGLALFFVILPRLFAQRRPARVASWLGSTAGVISGLAYVGIACTPANVALAAHGMFVQVAFMAFLVAVLFYIPAILLRPDYPKRYAVGMTVFALLLAAYVWLLFSGPRPGSAQGLVIQATGQKVIVYAAIVTTFFEAEGARRLVARRGLPAAGE